MSLRSNHFSETLDQPAESQRVFFYVEYFMRWTRDGRFLGGPYRTRQAAVEYAALPFGAHRVRARSRARHGAGDEGRCIMSVSTSDLLARLAEPFDVSSVQWKPGATAGAKAMALPFLNASAIQERLDGVLGANWDARYEFLEGGAVLCQLRLKIGDEWHERCDVGQCGKGGENATKQGVSDAFKRAAQAWGHRQIPVSRGQAVGGIRPAEAAFHRGAEATALGIARHCLQCPASGGPAGDRRRDIGQAGARECSRG